MFGKRRMEITGIACKFLEDVRLAVFVGTGESPQYQCVEIGAEKNTMHGQMILDGKAVDLSECRRYSGKDGYGIAFKLDGKDFHTHFYPSGEVHVLVEADLWIGAFPSERRKGQFVSR